MKFKVELVSCLTYKDKDGDLSTRLGYRLLDPEYCQDTDKFKGYSEMSYFCKGTDLFNKFNKSMFGVPAELEINEKPSPNNPMRKITVLKSIKVNNELVNLL